jgi:hypothetical protein
MAGELRESSGEEAMKKLRRGRKLQFTKIDKITDNCNAKKAIGGKTIYAIKKQS